MLGMQDQARALQQPLARGLRFPGQWNCLTETVLILYYKRDVPRLHD